METKTPVTIFWMGEFGMGVNKCEAWLVEHGRRQYAQYPQAPYVVFVPKGKRKARKWQGGYRPYMVVLKGHGHELTPDGMYLPARPGTTPGVMVAEGRYSAFDDRWGTDFDAKLAAYCKPEMVVADYRGR